MDILLAADGHPTQGVLFRVDQRLRAAANGLFYEINKPWRAVRAIDVG